METIERFPDLPDFNSMNTKERIIWFNANYPKYLDIVLDRLCVYYMNTELSIKPTGNNHFADELFDYIYNISARSKNAYPILALLAFAGTTIRGTSCHQFALDENRPVNVFGKTEYFLELFESAPTLVQDKVIRVLTEQPEVIKNPLYTLKTRCAEIAATSGIPMSEFIRQRFSSSVTNFSICIKFLDAEFGTNVDFTERFEVSMNYTMYRVVSYLAVVEQIPIDYLILQDYSHVATLHGNPLNDVLHQALSFYLLATPAARMEAFGALLFPSVF